MNTTDDFDTTGANGVIYGEDFDRLADPNAWQGYTYKFSVWEWAADRYADTDEPDSWGDQTKLGPLFTLHRVMSKLVKTPYKWEGWLDTNAGTFQSTVVKTKKFVRQAIVTVERVDGKLLSLEERDYIETRLTLR